MSDTVNLSDSKVFRAETQIYLPCAEFDAKYLNPVEVRAGGKTVGWASIHPAYKEYGKINVSMVLINASPERLTLEMDSEPLYATLEGVCELSASPFEHVGVVTKKVFPHVENILVTAIDISRERSYDGQRPIEKAVF